jgi:hypothetical protein
VNLIGHREIPAKVFFDEPQSRPRVHVGFTPPHLLITSGLPTTRPGPIVRGLRGHDNCQIQVT